MMNKKTIQPSDIVVGIDPGPKDSAFCMFNRTAQIVEAKDFLPNIELIHRLTAGLCYNKYVAIESVACFGMPVGASVFETCYWIGRFIQAASYHNIAVGNECDVEPALVPRMNVKVHLCGQARAKDANVRQALIDRFGPQGTKKNPGVLYKVSGHIWSALAVAVTYSDLLQNQAKEN
jgi:hypothetical protein